MRWWAILLYAVIQKFFAILAAITAVVVFFTALTELPTVEQTFSQMGIRFVEGAFGFAVYAFIALLLALFAALGVYVIGQILELLVSLDENLRGLRADLRALQPETPQQEARRRGMSLAPVAPDPQNGEPYHAAAQRHPDTERRAAAQIGRDAQIRRAQSNNRRP